MINPKHIAEAAQSIDPVFANSAQYKSEILSEILGLHLIHKIESYNPIGSFKGRGVDWWFNQNPDVSEIVCASAGNFGQAVAYVGRKHKVAVTVFAAESANRSKVEAMSRLGANVILAGADFDAAKLAAEKYANTNGVFYLVDGLAAEIAEGAGSIMVELGRYPSQIDKFYVPVGNGSLINGIATWAKAEMPHTEVIGVVAENAPSMMLSWQEGEVINTDSADTIADGIAVRLPIKEAVDIMSGVIDRVIAVSEEEITNAANMLVEQENLIVEPSGCVSLAAIIKNHKHDRGLTVANLICGKNIKPKKS